MVTSTDSPNPAVEDVETEQQQVRGAETLSSDDNAIDQALGNFDEQVTRFGLDVIDVGFQDPGEIGYPNQDDIDVTGPSLGGREGERGTLNTDITDALTEGKGLIPTETDDAGAGFFDTSERELQRRIEERREAFSPFAEGAGEAVEGLTGSAGAGNVAEGAASAPVELASQGGAGLLLIGDTAVEVGANLPETVDEYGAGEVAYTGTEVAGRTVESALTQAEEDPFKTAGELAGGFVTGTAAVRTARRATDVGAAARDTPAAFRRGYRQGQNAPFDTATSRAGREFQEFVEDDRAQLNLGQFGRSTDGDSASTTISQSDLEGFDSPDGDPRGNPEVLPDNLDGYGSGRDRGAAGLDEQGSFVGSNTRQQDPAFGGSGKPNVGESRDFSAVRERIGGNQIAKAEPDTDLREAVETPSVPTTASAPSSAAPAFGAGLLGSAGAVVSPLDEIAVGEGTTDATQPAPFADTRPDVESGDTGIGTPVTTSIIGGVVSAEDTALDVGATQGPQVDFQDDTPTVQTDDTVGVPPGEDILGVEDTTPVEDTRPDTIVGPVQEQPVPEQVDDVAVVPPRPAPTGTPFGQGGQGLPSPAPTGPAGGGTRPPTPDIEDQDDEKRRDEEMFGFSEDQYVADIIGADEILFGEGTDASSGDRDGQDLFGF
ncbi:hypothetical protein B9G49_13380 [Halorubrum sp. SD683]|nr:hypothetical protein B9G49_13380 [Halorubrum sp. SD683]